LFLQYAMDLLIGLSSSFSVTDRFLDLVLTSTWSHDPDLWHHSRPPTDRRTQKSIHCTPEYQPAPIHQNIIRHLAQIIYGYAGLAHILKYTHPKCRYIPLMKSCL